MKKIEQRGRGCGRRKAAIKAVEFRLQGTGAPQRHDGNADSGTANRDDQDEAVARLGQVGRVCIRHKPVAQAADAARSDP